MEIRPLGSAATLDSATGNFFDNAQSVYVATTADATLTLKDSAAGSTTIGSMQLVENQTLVIRKETKEALFATGTATKGTKIAYPRG